MDITHVIQARITRTQDTQHCPCGQKAQFSYIGYEVFTEEQKNKVQFDVKFVGDLAKGMEMAKRSRENDAIYEATLREQQQGLLKQHTRSHDCFSCLAFLISSGMNIAGYGEFMLSRIKSGALWIIRDVTAPTAWATIETLHQDVVQLREDLRTASTIQITTL